MARFALTSLGRWDLFLYGNFTVLESVIIWSGWRLGLDWNRKAFSTSTLVVSLIISGFIRIRDDINMPI